LIRITLLAFVVFLTAGCLPRNAFAPPPDNWEMWKKPGTEDVVLWKDLLNCGYDSPFGGLRVKERVPRTLSQVAGSMICMERLGYTHSPRGRDTPICRISGWKSTDACLLGKDIPIPDPQRRLNGAYCKQYPKSRACIP